MKPKILLKYQYSCDLEYCNKFLKKYLSDYTTFAVGKIRYFFVNIHKIIGDERYVKARRELTPRVVREGILFGPRQNET